MKFIIRGLLLLAAIFMLFACSSDNEDTYNFNELSTPLIDTSGQEIEVFTSDGKELYLYFTGIS